MNNLLHMDAFGISLEYREGQEYPYVFTYQDVVGPVYHEVAYQTRHEAVGEIVNYLFNPDNFYALEDTPDLCNAYKLLGVPLEVSENKWQDAAKTMLCYILDDIIYTNDLY